MKSEFVILATLAALVQPDSALSQTGVPRIGPRVGQMTYDVRTVDFDLWCQQTQRYDFERCNDRRLEDVEAFEEYRAAVERFELNYLKQIRRYQDLRDDLNRDPFQTVQRRQDGLP